MIQHPTENTQKSIESFNPIYVDQSFGETSYLISVINPGGIMINKILTETSHLRQSPYIPAGLVSQDDCVGRLNI